MKLYVVVRQERGYPEQVESIHTSFPECDNVGSSFIIKEIEVTSYACALEKVEGETSELHVLVTDLGEGRINIDGIYTFQPLIKPFIQYAKTIEVKNLKKTNLGKGGLFHV